MLISTVGAAQSMVTDSALIRSNTATGCTLRRQIWVAPAAVTVQNTARLLCVHQAPIDAARMFKRFFDGALRDLIKGDAIDGDGKLFLTIPCDAKFLGQMGGNGLAFAVRVRCEIDCVGLFRQFFELGEDFFLAGNDYVFGLEIAVRIDAQLALGQILHVPE